MKREKTPTPPAGNSRPQSEKRSKENELPNADDLSRTDDRALAHELQVHPIELELQNEELRRAQAETQEAQQKYTELFDFVPVGYHAQFTRPAGRSGLEHTDNIFRLNIKLALGQGVLQQVFNGGEADD